MTSDRQQHLEALVEAALAQPFAKRDAFLEDTCGTNPELRAELDGLLAAASTDETPGILKASPSKLASVVAEPEDSATTALGRCRLGASRTGEGFLVREDHEILASREMKAREGSRPRIVEPQPGLPPGLRNEEDLEMTTLGAAIANLQETQGELQLRIEEEDQGRVGEDRQRLGPATIGRPPRRTGFRHR